MSEIKDKVVSLEILKVTYDELKEETGQLSEEMEEFDNTVSELKDTKLSLPTDSEGNVLTGTAGQALVSDGNGGTAWATSNGVTTEELEAKDYATTVYVNKAVKEKVDRNNVWLAKHTDGLIYLFIDGEPVGTGLEVGGTIETYDVSGNVDSNNTITLNGNLADGTYILKYMDADGNTVKIGELVLGETVAYTNLFDSTTATLNSRWSNSSYALTTTNGYVVSPFIAVTVSSDTYNPTILRFRGGAMADKASIIYYNSSKTILADTNASSVGADCSASQMAVTTDENGDYQTSLGYKNDSFIDTWADAAYIRVVLQINSTATAITTDDIQDIIITINEPITD